MFKNKILLVTGGTGSFGWHFVKKVLKTPFNEIRVLSRDEKKQDDMRKFFNNKKLKFFIGDVRDINSIDLPMKNCDFVFHAAALKQVPSCEFFPMESVKTNILGTENVLNCAFKNKVKKIICLSTDKAVYPINAMGISKAMMERLAISKSMLFGNTTKICITRYGNVAGSRGSVIPLFYNQIKNNQKITVTDLDMTRFIMSLDEAIDLVLYAFKYGKTGETYIPKTLASSIEDIINSLKGFFDKKKIKLKIIGKRHGEKKHEVLMTKEEMEKAVNRGRYFMIPTDNRNLNYEKYISLGNVRKSIKEYSSNNAKKIKLNDLKKIISNSLKEKIFEK